MSDTSQEVPTDFKIDLTENAEDSQVRQWYKKLMTQVLQIDEVLDEQADAATGGKRRFTKELIAKNEGDWKPVSEHLINQMKEMDPEVLSGVFFGIIRSLSDEFKDNVDKWVNDAVASQPKVEVTPVDDEQKKALMETRADLAKQVKTIIEMAYVFGEAKSDENEEQNDPNWPAPRVRHGRVGPRGKRALTLFTWEIDGVAVDEDNDSVKGVSALVGFEKAADFTAALRDAGIDTTNPGDEIQVELKGKQVYGKRITEEDDAAEEVVEATSEEAASAGE